MSLRSAWYRGTSWDTHFGAFMSLGFEYWKKPNMKKRGFEIIFPMEHIAVWRVYTSFRHNPYGCDSSYASPTWMTFLISNKQVWYIIRCSVSSGRTWAVEICFGLHWTKHRWSHAWGGSAPAYLAPGQDWEIPHQQRFLFGFPWNPSTATSLWETGVEQRQGSQGAELEVFLLHIGKSEGKFSRVASLCDVSVHTHGPFASMLPHSLAPTWCFANRSRSDAAWTLSLSVPVSVCWCCTCSLHWQVLCQGYWWRTRAFRLQHPLHQRMLKISPLSREIWGSHICCNIIWYRVNFFFANILKSLKPPRKARPHGIWYATRTRNTLLGSNSREPKANAWSTYISVRLSKHPRIPFITKPDNEKSPCIDDFRWFFHWNLHFYRIFWLAMFDDRRIQEKMIEGKTASAEQSWPSETSMIS